MKIKQRHFIKSSEVKTLKEEIRKKLDNTIINQIFPKKCGVELIITENGDELYAINNELKIWKSKEGYIPVLKLLLENKINLKSIVVDMGAVRFVANKADVMRPGITHIDPLIKKGDIIKIVDETHKRSLAVGKALYDAEEMKNKTSGKVVKNLHTINDDIWKFEKEFK
ncbi:MAG: RNA-binding protein [Candidatus Hermodarchaeota archaeon]